MISTDSHIRSGWPTYHTDDQTLVCAKSGNEPGCAGILSVVCKDMIHKCNEVNAPMATEHCAADLLSNSSLGSDLSLLNQIAK